MVVEVVEVMVVVDAAMVHGKTTVSMDTQLRRSFSAGILAVFGIGTRMRRRNRLASAPRRGGPVY